MLLITLDTNVIDQWRLDEFEAAMMVPHQFVVASTTERERDDVAAILQPAILSHRYSP